MTSLPDVLEVAGVRLPLIDTAAGPRLDPDGDAAGLAIVVNGFLEGLLPDLPNQLRRRAPVHAAGLYADTLPEDADVTEPLEPWRRLSHSDVTDDPVIVGIPGEVSVLPRAALLEILDRMQELNAHEPQKDNPATDTHEERLARAIANRPGAPGRAEELERLEARARELDAMSDPAEAAARRRTLLIELDGADVLSGRPEVARELSDLNLPTLLGYHAAARRLLDYLVSPERGELVPDALAEPVLGARVSLDFFRCGPQVPPDGTERRWTALGEAMLVASSPKPTVEGEFYSQWDGRWYHVRWRRDDGNTPALLDLSQP